MFSIQFPHEQLNSFEVCDDIDKCLNRLKFDDKLAVATSRLHIQAMPLHQRIFCFDRSQNIYSYLNSFKIRMDYPKRHDIDKILKEITTAGLVSKWQKDIRRYIKSKKRHSDVHSINITDFYFAFLFAMLLTNLSISAILIEFIIYYKVNSSRSKHYWQFWDKFISGKRYFLLLEPRCDDVIIPFTH